MTNFSKNYPFKILACLTVSLLIGCQGIQPTSTRELALQDNDFLGLWDAYNFCVVGQNIQELKENLGQLHSAPKPISLDDSPIPIPSFIKKFSSTKNSRLAVDPRAMAASCSLHVAKVARQSHDLETAYRILSSMATEYPEPQYSYYVSEAHQTLEALSSSVRPVSLPQRESLGY